MHEMKLDRNITGYNGRGKYALVRLRGIDKNEEALQLLAKLATLGFVDFGEVGAPDEFFVIKLCDVYSRAAIKSYSDAVMEAAEGEVDPDKARDKAQYALEIQQLNQRAGILSPFCKEPD
jgi:hypothetical protein